MSASARADIAHPFWRPGHIPALDGLRGIAVILVMLSHFRIFYPVQSNLLNRGLRVGLGLGWCGVDLFFVLSGFLITGILLEEKGKTATKYFSRFYIRRVLRIFPLYYSFLLLLMLVGIVIPGLLDRRELVWYFVYLQNWRLAFGHGSEAINHFWSLAIEEQFYLIWPFLAYWTSTKSLFRICISAFVLVQLLRPLLVLTFSVSGNFLYCATVTRMDGILLGSILAISIRDPDLLVAIQKYHVAVGLLCLAALVGLGALSRTLNLFVGATPFVMLAPPLFAGFFASVVSRVVLVGGRLSNWSWLRQAGKYSYAMYIFHLPILSIIISEGFRDTIFDYHALQRGPLLVWLVGGTAGMVVCCLATFGAALISWWALESRMLALKDRLT